jgi:hypothetical protein
MEKKELQKLAQKIQLEIKAEELPAYLETFEYLEKLLVEFKKVRMGKKAKSLMRINIGHLTLKDLVQLKNKFSQVRISKKDRAKNSLSTDDDFVLFKK